MIDFREFMESIKQLTVGFDFLQLAFNIIFVIIITLAVIILLDIANEKYKRDKLYGRLKERNFKGKFLEKIKFFKIYKDNLEILLIEKNREGNLELIFNATIISLVAISIYLVTVKQILLAIIIPIVLLKFVNKAVQLMATNIMEKVEEQLPFAIDNIIRVSSKYGDLKSIIYETSRSCEAPTKNIFENVARKMISGNTEKVLLDLAEEYDNIWIYSLVFTLLSYLEDANKDDTTKNLRHLRDILEKENSLKTKNITDKRYGVVVNYAIAILATVAGVLNIIFNPSGKKFFFSTFSGLICFIVGYGAVLITIMLNIIMSKSKKK